MGIRVGNIDGAIRFDVKKYIYNYYIERYSGALL